MITCSADCAALCSAVAASSALDERRRVDSRSSLLKREPRARACYAPVTKVNEARMKRSKTSAFIGDGRPLQPTCVSCAAVAG